MMRRMMAPTMTLDTISNIRMVLIAWVMVMRIASWAEPVPEVQGHCPLK